MNEDRLGPLLEGYLDGTLSAEDRAALEHAIESDEALRRELAGQLRMAGSLQAMLTATSAQERVESIRRALRAGEGPAQQQFLANVRARIETTERLPWWRTWTPTLLGAALATVALVLVVWGRAPSTRLAVEPPATVPEAPPPVVTASQHTSTASPPALAKLERLAGTVYLLDGAQRTAVTAGAAIGARQGIATVGAASSARVAFPDRSTLDLAGDTLLTSLEGGGAGSPRGALLGAGTVQTAAAAPFVMVTPHGQATGSAARWSTDVTATGTRVSVDEGQVRVAGVVSGEVEVQHGRQALVVSGGAPTVSATDRPDGDVAAFLVGNTPLSPADELVAARLGRLGYMVVLRGADEPPDAKVRGARLIVISATVASMGVAREYRDLEVPMLVNESALFDDLGMALPTFRDLKGQEEKATIAQPAVPEILIREPSHPLAAGLSGWIRVADTQVTLRRGHPGPYAAWVATQRPRTQAFAWVFGYERGAPMIDGRAPARRVGFFLHNDTASFLNEQGWRLFDAAARWCAEDSGRRPQ